MRAMQAWLLLAAVASLYFGYWGIRYQEGEAYRAALAYVEASPQVRDQLGDDVSISRFPLGWIDDVEGEARLGVTARGPEGSVGLLLALDRVSDVWHVTEARSRGEDGGATESEAGDAELEAVDEETLNRAASRTAGGYALFQRDMLDEAVEELTLAIETDSTYVEAWYWRSQVHMARGDTVASIEDLEVAVRSVPNHVQALADLGRVHALRGDYAAAVAYLERVAAIDPRRPGVLQTLDRAREELAAQGGAGTASR